MIAVASVSGVVRSSRAVAVIAVVVALCGAAPPVLAQPQPPSRQQFALSILSSRPDQVSGGDALVRVEVPQTVPVQQVTVLRNGEDVTTAFAPAADGRALEGVVQGFEVGRNELVAQPNGRGQGRPDLARLTLTNHPIEGPIFSGPHQQPFVCTTARATFDGRRLLGQPVVDNQDHVGIPVAAEDANGNYPADSRGYPTADAQIVGWSADCATPTRTGYLYQTTGGAFRWLDDPTNPPPDVAMTTTLDGRHVPYVVRWERGTINRFIYSIAMLAPSGESTAQPDAFWNGRLVFSLQGGVAIGHTQGT